MILFQVGLGLIALAYAMVILLALGVVGCLVYEAIFNNLRKTYKKIKQGMTFDQVQAITGTRYNFEMQESDGRKYASWTEGTYQAAGSITIRVAFGSGGADEKQISTKKADGTYDPAGSFNASNNGW